jgi:hypothetical protein
VLAHKCRKASRAIARSCQRELQEMFAQIYNEPARSNNNVWLRKKLLEGEQRGYQGNPQVAAAFGQHWE